MGSSPQIATEEFDTATNQAESYGEETIRLLTLEVLLDIRELLRERLDPPPL